MLNRKHLSLCVIFLSAECIAQKKADSSKVDEKVYFQAATFCKPFVSELQNCLTKFEVDYASNSSEYDLSSSNKKYKVFQATSIGVDFPVYMKYHYQNGKLKSGFAISAPVSFHLWWDPLELSTSPVLSTDYRFGTVNFKFIRFWLGDYRSCLG